MKIYTRRGDDGTTSLLSGVRVQKDSPAVELNGAIDEAQAALGLARAECASNTQLNELLAACERDLWVVMAEIAAPPDRGSRAGEVTPEMVTSLEKHIDSALEEFTSPTNFAVPGENRLSATLDFARTVVRRAERLAVADQRAGNVVAYLNRLSDLCWALARSCEDEHLVSTRTTADPQRIVRSPRPDSSSKGRF